MQYQGLGPGVRQRAKPLPTTQGERVKKWSGGGAGQILFQADRGGGSIHAQLADRASRFETGEYSCI